MSEMVRDIKALSDRADRAEARAYECELAIEEAYRCLTLIGHLPTGFDPYSRIEGATQVLARVKEARNA